MTVADTKKPEVTAFLKNGARVVYVGFGPGPLFSVHAKKGKRGEYTFGLHDEKTGENVICAQYGHMRECRCIKDYDFDDLQQIYIESNTVEEAP